jgi:type I restriction enzyme R subunit
MMNCAFTESVVEEAAIAWLESVGCQVRNGAEIAPGELRVKEAARAIKETTV